MREAFGSYPPAEQARCLDGVLWTEATLIALSSPDDGFLFSLIDGPSRPGSSHVRNGHLARRPAC
jgi:hypothetical protein